MFQNRVLSVFPEERYRIGASRLSVKDDFCKNTIRERLSFLRWIELISSVISFFLVILAVYTNPVTKTNLILGILVNLACIILLLGDMLYFYFYRAFPIATLLATDLVFSVSYYSSAVALILTENVQGILVVVATLDIVTGTFFFVDLSSKIILFSFLRKSTRVTSVADVGITAYIANPPSHHRPTKPSRSSLTVVPRTYGGTFPIGKNLPPFLPQKRFESAHEVYNAELYERAPRKSKVVQADVYVDHEPKVAAEKADKATGPSTPDYDKRKIQQRTPWTYSSPATARKSTRSNYQPMTGGPVPITYSGTFACNNEVVPVTHDTYESPISTPRNMPSSSKSRINLKESLSKSEHNSPRKLREDISLSRISEETTPSLVRSSCRICSASELYFSPNQMIVEEPRKTSWKTLMLDDPYRDRDRHY